MRDKRFVAKHRGGPFDKNQHRQLIGWAFDCVRHVLPLFGGDIDERIVFALKVAKEWAKGNASVGDARNAAFGAIAAANGTKNPAKVAIARAAGHAVATAHMADHAPGAAEYALKALAILGKPIKKERKWQNNHLPLEIKELVLSSRKMNIKFWEASFRKAQNIKI
jgi:hypothetical protein